MKQEKLGRLIFGEEAEAAAAARQQSRPPSRWRYVWLAAVPLFAVATVVGCQTGWLPAQFTPRRVVIRGCDLTPAAQVRDLLGATPGASYLQLWRAARALKPGNQRWLTHMSARPLAGRGLLILASERRPVLRLESAGAGYWLCDNGEVVRAQPEDTKQARFAALAQLPVMKLAGLSPEQAAGDMQPLLLTAGLCGQVLPGQIKVVEVNARHEFTLRDQTGLEIRLGGAQDLAVKIAALPKALRAASADRSKLAYLDATGERSGSRLVIYENLKEPVK